LISGRNCKKHKLKRERDREIETETAKRKEKVRFFEILIEYAACMLL